MGTTFPMLANMVQKALNAEHHIAQGETWDQVLHQCATLAKNHVKTDTSGMTKIDWDRVSNDILKSVPSCAYDLQRWSVSMGMVRRFHVNISCQ